MWRGANSKTIISFWNSVDNWYRNNGIVTEFIRFSLNNNHLYYTRSIIPTLDNVKCHILEEKIQGVNYEKKLETIFEKQLR